MKFIKFILFSITTTCITLSAVGQANPFINVLPSNSGIVAVGSTIDIVVTIGNTGPISDIAQAKLRPIIQVPPSVTFLPNAQQTGLPTGWSILTNTGSQLRVCNSTDPIQVNTSRTITLKVQGVTVTGPQTFSGNINFGNGTTCAAGTSVAGDLTTDNSATSTVEVVAGTPLPSILNNFFVQTDNCSAQLNWSTTSEVNSAKFEIDKSESNEAKWKTIGSVKARGNSSIYTTYNFQDETIFLNKSIVMYRLKMIDIDGSYKYSNIINSVITCNEENISVFPNPVTNGSFNVSLSSNENVEATLSSATGQLLKKVILKDGMNTIDVSELGNGLYYLSTKFTDRVNQNVKITIEK